MLIAKRACTSNLTTDRSSRSFLKLTEDRPSIGRQDDSPLVRMPTSRMPMLGPYAGERGAYAGDRGVLVRAKDQRDPQNSRANYMRFRNTSRAKKSDHGMAAGIIASPKYGPA